MKYIIFIYIWLLIHKCDLKPLYFSLVSSMYRKLYIYLQIIYNCLGEYLLFWGSFGISQKMKCIEDSSILQFYNSLLLCWTVQCLCVFSVWAWKCLQKSSVQFTHLQQGTHFQLWTSTVPKVVHDHENIIKMLFWAWPLLNVSRMYPIK